MPHTLTLSETARKIRDGDLSPIDLLNDCLNHIDALDDRPQRELAGVA